MNGEAVQAVIDTAQKAVAIKTVVLDGKTFVDTEAGLVEPEVLVKQYMADTLSLESLTGLVDYLKANPDGLKLAEHLVVVGGPNSVELVSKLNTRRDRETLVRCVSKKSAFRFQTYHDQQTFIIALLTMFSATPDLDALVELVKTVVDDEQVKSEDNGVAQTLTVQKSAGLREFVTVKPIHNLAPLRTFTEVEQPVSPFLLRIQKAEKQPPKLALFEADGGAWEQAARQAVASWLRSSFSTNTLPVKVLA